MNIRAWIFSDDEALSRLAAEVLTRELGVKPNASTRSQLDQVQLSENCLHHVLVDLRTADVTSVLEKIARNWHDRPGPVVQIVGIVEQGYSTTACVLADHVLDASLLGYQLESRLPAILKHLAKTVPATESQFRRHVVRAGDSEFVTSSPAIISQLEMLDLVAGRDLTVLLIGETGTGKTTLARIIHNKSSRCDQPFLALSCASISNELIGSELFGHVKGAFTGAERTKIGKFEAVGSGTILLDEIDVLSPMHQANLLRVIETGEFEPVGSNETHESRARIIAAANVCLRSLSESGQFRSDLYYRLNQVSFELPPLRERPEDLVPLAVHLIEECCREQHLHVDAISPDFINAIEGYSWPGNIRELRNEVRRAVLFCNDGHLTEHLLSDNLKRPRVGRAPLGEPASQHSRLDSNVARKEAETIKTALEVHQFNRAATARALGISRVTLYNKIRKYQIRIDGPRV